MNDHVDSCSTTPASWTGPFEVTRMLRENAARKGGETTVVFLKSNKTKEFMASASCVVLIALCCMAAFAFPATVAQDTARCESSSTTHSSVAQEICFELSCIGFLTAVRWLVSCNRPIGHRKSSNLLKRYKEQNSVS